MKKRALQILTSVLALACTLVVGFAGCGDSTAKPNPNPNNPSSPVEPEEPSNPTDPDNPENPDYPNNPENPENPSDPSDGYKPGDPIDLPIIDVE